MLDWFYSPLAWFLNWAPVARMIEGAEFLSVFLYIAYTVIALGVVAMIALFIVAICFDIVRYIKDQLPDHRRARDVDEAYARERSGHPNEADRAVAQGAEYERRHRAREETQRIVDALEYNSPGQEPKGMEEAEKRERSRATIKAMNEAQARRAAHRRNAMNHWDEPR